MALEADTFDRFAGSFCGLAVGDQLGSLVEGKDPGTFEIGDMPSGSFWTDDTAHALCLADSLVACGGFDLIDQTERLCRWLFEGYMSSQESAYGCGPTAKRALTAFKSSGSPEPVEDQATNGALMRLAPVPLYFYRDLKLAIARSGESALSTHAHRQCIDACRLYGSMIVKAVCGESKADVLKYDEALWQKQSLDPAVEAIARGSYVGKTATEIRGTLNVLQSLEAALWCVHETSTFEDATLSGVNLGYDTDTTSAIAGQVAGALYGYVAIPASWREALVKRDLVDDMAFKLWRASHGGSDA